MIETEGADTLLTWKIAKQDLDLFVRGAVIKAERLTDHRKEYLVYEGPVSNNRGSVKIFDSGECVTVLKEDNKFVFDLNGGKLAGTIMIDYNNSNKLFSLKFIPAI